jgi:hypothetical protein
METGLFWDDSDDSSASVDAGVGISMQCVVPFAVCTIVVPVIVSSVFGSHSIFAESHTDGWIGIHVQQFDLNNVFVGDALVFRNDLWRDNSYVGGAGWHQTTSNLIPLVVQMPVFWGWTYVVWAWCGGRIQAAGKHATWSSQAESSLSIVVPFMTWQI